MTLRERFDFAILIAVFSSFVAALVIRLDSLLCSSVSHIDFSINTFSVLSSQWMVRIM